MKWIEATIYTHHDGLEIMSAKLMEMGIDSIAITDQADFDDFVENNKDKWDLIDETLTKEGDVETNIKVYLTDDSDGRENFEKISSLLDELRTIKDINFGKLRVEVATVDDSDWVDNWKELFTSFEIGKTFMVEAPWAENVLTDKTVIFIDPGASFGSGLHESTKLCVEFLEKYIKSGDIVADVGCGSGILSVVAAKLGAKVVNATDIDPFAVEAAENCAKLNGCEKTVKISLSDLISDKEPYDCIVANIFPDVIKRLAPTAFLLLKAGGVFITSGILNEYAKDVENALKDAGFSHTEKISMNEWISICAKK